jgi:hypothetical protein
MSRTADAVAASTRAAKSAVDVGLRRPDLVATTALATVLLILILFWSPSYWIGVLAALALPALLHRHPAALVVLMSLVAEEVVPLPTIGPVTTLGHQAFYQGKVPLVLVVALSATVVAAVRLRPWQRLRLGTDTWIVLGIVCALASVMAVAGFIDGQGLFSAVNQNARPCVACVAGLVIGVTLRFMPAESRAATYVAAVTVVGLALAAAIAVPLGWSADARVSPYFVYYDSALPALAVAVFLALVASVSRLDWRAVVVMAACLLIVVFSFRRAVWLATSVPIAAILLLAAGRLRSSRRLLVAAAGLALFVVIMPGLAVDVRARLVGAPSVHLATTSTAQNGTVAGPGGGPATGASTRPGGNSSARPGGSSSASPGGSASVPARSNQPGTGGATGKPQGAPVKANSDDYVDSPSADVAADSAEGHLGDLKVGWNYVKQHFWTGMGPRAPQPPGLAAAKSRRVYVHDEWLLDWLRYGPLAALLAAAFVGMLVLMAIRMLLRFNSATIERTAAIFALVAPGCLVLFPYLTTTTRWPLMLGIAAGILGGRRGTDEQTAGRHRRGEATRSEVAVGNRSLSGDAVEVAG